MHMGGKAEQGLKLIPNFEPRQGGMRIFGENNSDINRKFKRKVVMLKIL